MTRRRLLIDASAGFNQGAGIGRYSRSILHAALPLLESDFDIRVWYAGEGKGPATFETEALAAFSDKIRTRVARSWLSRRRIDQLSRLPIGMPGRLLAGKADVAYSPDFTLPGEFRAATVITVHDLAFEMVPEAYPAGLLSYLRTVVPASVRRATQIAVVSRTTRIDIVERYNISPDRIVVIPNAADERFFDAPPLPAQRLSELGIPGNYLLAVGTIEPRKNYRSLLSAQERAFAETGRPLVVVGRQGWNNKLEMAHLQQLAGSGAVIPLIDAAESDLPGLYAGADAAVYVPLYEGFGLPVLEALATGATVVTSDIPSVREIASGNATVVPPLDIDQLASALTEAHRGSPEEHQKRRSAARQYSWEASGSMLRETLIGLV